VRRITDKTEPAAGQTDGEIRVRPIEAPDLPSIVALDGKVTGIPKPNYFKELYDLLGTGRRPERIILVAEEIGEIGEIGEIKGFVIGEVREWVFGTPRCGWITAIATEPAARERGIASQLFESISHAFHRAGADTIRTLPPRDDQTVVSFFRSQGMMAGPGIELERKLR